MTRRLFLVIAALAVGGCSGTERTRRTFPVSVTGDATALVTDSGWSVQLDRASASAATLRFFSGKVLLSRRVDPWSWLVPTAHAHPGHYVAGEALGELLVTRDFDLLAGPAQWGVASAVTGEYGSAQLGLSAMRLAGTATKGAQVVAFDTGTFTPAAPLEGLAFDQVMDTSAGRVLITVQLASVLSRVDFAAVGAAAAPIDPASAAFNGFARGVADTSTYAVTWRKE